MIYNMIKKIFVSLFLISSLGFGQTKDPDAIIKNLKSAFSHVKDYIADVSVKADIKSLKVPEMKAKVYFKQPDKVHLQSEGFALLPKDGLYTSPLSFLDLQYTAIYVKDETLDGVNTSVVKIIPLEDKGNFVLTTLWIDQAKNVIRKVEATTKVNGTLNLILSYDDNITRYPLPSGMVFSFNTKKAASPDQMLPGNGDKNQMRSLDLVSGKIYISYSNYVVNKGIPDSIFEKKNSSGE